MLLTFDDARDGVTRRPQKTERKKKHCWRWKVKYFDEKSLSEKIV